MEGEASNQPGDGPQGLRDAMVSRKGLVAALAAAGAAAVGSAAAPMASAAPSSDRINVRTFGAIGDGVSNDTAAVRSAMVAAAGAEIYFPAGVYVLDSLVVDAQASFQLDHGAVLRHRAGGGSGSMILFRGTVLRISGGTVDGNKDSQAGRPYIVTGTLQQGKTIEFLGVHFTRTVASVVYVQHFGGQLSMESCRVTDQAEHDGIAGHTTSILRTISGQADGHGLVRFNHNICVGTENPAIPGGNPGGIFVAANGYVEGAPGSLGFAQGNLSTLEAVGNYFWGYGQNAAGNDISPIHTYPAIGGARIIGNYFERCGFCAISAKSVQDFVCTGNVISNGLVSSQNVASEGAISYMPGYQAAMIPRPRAVISGNVVDSPGGQPGERQSGISVHGLAGSVARQVIVSDNVLSGCGRGIKVNYVEDITISGNVIDGSRGTVDYTKDEDGIRVDNALGTVMVSGNRISTPHGYGLYALAGVSSARFVVSDNVFEHSSSSHYATTLRACAFIRLDGNTYRATAGLAVYLTASGTTKIQHLHVGDNAFIAGGAVFDFANIVRATGRLHGTVDPRGRVTPGEAGTIYRCTTGRAGDVLWISTGTTAADWTPVVSAGVDGQVPTFRVAAGAGTGASATVRGTDSEGVVQVTSGAAPSAHGLIGTMAFRTARGVAPKAVLLTPANAVAAALSPGVYVVASSLATTGFAVNSAGDALSASVVHQWHYRVF